MLIVDDEVQARELLSEFCRAQGYEIATANDGRAAIAALIRSPQWSGYASVDSAVGHESRASGDLTWRLQAIEERIAHIEALLRARS